MATVAGGAEVLIPATPAVLRIHRCPVVLMAEYAFESGKAGGIDMAVGARAPFASVLARVYREILAVVIPVGRRPGARGMA